MMARPLSSFIARAQPMDDEPWDTDPVIPKDDSAVLTTLLPLVVLLLVFGTILASSVRSGGSPSGFSLLGWLDCNQDSVRRPVETWALANLEDSRRPTLLHLEVVEESETKTMTRWAPQALRKLR